MKLEAFSKVTRTKVKRHEDREPIILGRHGHIYEHDGNEMGLLFLPGKPRRWAHAKRKLETAGFTIWQDGDEEGSALFCPENPAQARLALKVVGVKRRRKATLAQLANLRKAPGREPSSALESKIVPLAAVGVAV